MLFCGAPERLIGLVVTRVKNFFIFGFLLYLQCLIPEGVPLDVRFQVGSPLVF